MESGSLAEWMVDEGSEFSAGDSLARIETDKATIDFEAQDDGIVARLLIKAGTGDNIAVGEPIMVTVEESDAVAAFADFTPPAAAAAPPAKEEAAPAAAPVAPPPPAPVVAAAVVTPPPPPPPVEAAPVAAPVASAPAPAVASPPTAGPAWGNLAKVSSPLSKTLSKDQKQYISLYGSTGQLPL